MWICVIKSSTIIMESCVIEFFPILMCFMRDHHNSWCSSIMDVARLHDIFFDLYFFLKVNTVLVMIIHHYVGRWLVHYLICLSAHNQKSRHFLNINYLFVLWSKQQNKLIILFCLGFILFILINLFPPKVYFLNFLKYFRSKIISIAYAYTQYRH